MSVTAAELLVRIDADVKDFEKKLGVAEGRVNDFAGKAGIAAGVVAGGLTAALGAAVKTAGDFEETMDGVTAVMDADEVGKFGGSLEKLALQLGKDTAFSAKEAASGLEELIKGGVGAQDIMDGAAKGALNLAAAGGVGLADAAEIASNALAQFSLSGKDMAHVSDLIAGAANASSIGVGDFKYSLSAAGAVAATVGFSFDDLSEAIAIMGKAGIKGSDAGTSLKTMMLNLQPATKAQVAEMERLGIVGINTEGAFTALADQVENNADAQKAWEKETKAGTASLDNMFKIAQKFGMIDKDIDFNKWAFDAGYMGNQFFDASGKVKGMADVAEVLQGSMEGMTEQQKLASLEIMFGSDAIRAGAVLAKEGAEGFNEMAGAMGKVTAEEVGSKKLDNWNGAMGALGGSIETAAIVIGQKLLPAMRGLTEFVTGLVNRFLELSPEAQTFITWGLVGATVVAGLAAAVLGLVAILPTLAAGFAVASTAAAIVGGVLAGPVLLAIGAVVLAVALLALAWNTNFLGIRDAATNAWNWLNENVFTPLGTELSKFVTEILPVFEKAWASMTAGVQKVWEGLIAVLRPGLQAFAADWDTKWNAIKTVLNVVWEGIKLIVGIAWEATKGIIYAGLALMEGDWKTAWNNILFALEEIWRLIQGTIGKAIGEIIEGFKTWAIDAFNAAIEVGKQIIEGIKKGIGDAAAGLAEAAKGAVQGALSAAKEAAGSGAASVASTVAGAASAGFDWAAHNFKQNEEKAHQANVAAGRGGGPVLGGDAGNAATSALNWAQSKLGSQDWNWLCERFVEMAYGTSGKYSSAAAAANALMTNRGGTPGKGSLVFFRPDASNANYGHVGISLGGNQFISATANGVKVDSLNSSYWGSLYQGFGVPKFAAGVRNFLGGMAIVGDRGPELVNLPRGSDVYPNSSYRQAAGRAVVVNVHVAGSVIAERELLRTVRNGLLDMKRTRIDLGLS